MDNWQDEGPYRDHYVMELINQTRKVGMALHGGGQARMEGLAPHIEDLAAHAARVDDDRAEDDIEARYKPEHVVALLEQVRLVDENRRSGENLTVGSGRDLLLRLQALADVLEQDLAP